jgi:hypothetical protein
VNPPNYFAVLIYFFTPKLIHKKNSRQASREILLLRFNGLTFAQVREMAEGVVSR